MRRIAGVTPFLHRREFVRSRTVLPARRYVHRIGSVGKKGTAATCAYLLGAIPLALYTVVYTFPAKSRFRSFAVVEARCFRERPCTIRDTHSDPGGTIMTTRAAINDFLARKKLALIRSSRTKPVRGSSIDKELASRGFSVSVVYLDEQGKGATLKALNGSFDGVIIAVPAELSEKAVGQAVDAGIPRVWLQLGAESAPAIDLCIKKGITVVSGECILMFADPVKSYHAFHRWLWKLLGKLPE